MSTLRAPGSWPGVRGTAQSTRYDTGEIMNRIKNALRWFFSTPAAYNSKWSV